MSKHLVLVVHGVGQQKPGETVDQVVGGAMAHAVTDGAPVRVTDQSFTIPTQPYNGVKPGTPAKRIAEHFPMNVRQVSSIATAQPDETTFAEVYWADKSPAPETNYQIMFEVFRLILRIGYLALDSVDNTRGKFAQFVVHFFNWVFYGGIAALSVVMLVGSLLLLLHGIVYDFSGIDPNYTLRIALDRTIESIRNPEIRRIPFLVPLSPKELLCGSAGILAILGAMVLGKGQRPYLVRIFGIALLFWAVMTVIIISYVTDSDTTNRIQCNFFGLNTPFNMDARLGFHHNMLVNCYVGTLLMFSNFAGLAMLGAIFLMYLIWMTPRLAKPITDGQGGQREIYATISSGMILFWFVAVESVWVVFAWLVTRFSTPNEHHITNFSHAPDGLMYQVFRNHLEPGLDTMPITVVFLIIFLLVALGIIGFRWIFKNNLHERAQSWRRLILNPLFQIVFATSTLALAISAASAFDVIPGALGEWVKRGFFTLKGLWHLTSIVLLFLALLVYFFSDRVGLILGTFGGIALYAVRSRSGLQQKLSRVDYPHRQAIENRFERVCEYMLAVEKPQKLTIIAHSLGTVVATRCFVHAVDICDKLPKNVTLITMGSPVDHIHRQYFPQDFKLPPERFENINWFNIFRTDDFVGTKINMDGVRNLAVEPAGHSMYFTDSAV